MKVWILALLVGCAIAAPSFNAHNGESRTVSDLLEDLIDELGLAELLPWFEEMIRNDPDVQRIVAYLRGPKFQKIIEHLKQCPGYIETKDKLLEEGIDLADILQRIRDWLAGVSPMKARRTLGEILNELLSRLDIDHIIEVLKDKIANDPDMKKVIDFLKSDTFKGIVSCMKESPEVQELIEKLKDEGIDFKQIIEMIKNLFGSKYIAHDAQSRKVSDFLKDLIDELDLRDFLLHLADCLRDDPDFQRIIDVYLRGPAFKRIIAHLQQCPDYIDSKDKLAEEGIDLAEMLLHIRDWFVSISPVKTRRTIGIGGFCDKLLRYLDLDHIIAVFKDKIANDPDMKKVIDFLHGETFKGIVECMKESQDVQGLIEKLKEEGIDIIRLIEMIKDLFGGRNSHAYGRKVFDLLEELIDEFGLRDHLPWFEDMVRNDFDVQRFIAYLRGPKFQKIISHLQQCPDYIASKDDLKKEGIDLAEMLQHIRDWFAGISPIKSRQARRTLAELLNELLSRLDISHIIAVLQDKIANDPDMQKVINFLKSDTLKGIVACMKESPEVQDLIERLKEEGIDIERIVEMIKNLFGSKYIAYHAQSRKVADPWLPDPIEELGLRDLLPWFEDQVRNDPDVQRFLEYLRGPAFKRIIAHLQQCPDYVNSKDELAEIGFDLAIILQHIRDWLAGISPVKARRTLGEILNELLSRLGLDNIIAAVKDKMAQDPDMKKVIDFLTGETFRGIVECMKESKDVQDLVQKLKDEGIDIYRLIEIIRNLFGGFFLL